MYNTHDGEINADYFSGFTELIQSHPSNYFLVVMGGGSVARDYIRAAARLGVDKEGQDLLGIDCTRINARMMALLLAKEGISANFIRNLNEEHRRLLEQYQVIVTGGTIPGHTTDRVAVQYAAKYGDGNLINVTSVGGIHDENPISNPSANLIREVKGSELIALWGTEHVPGMSRPIEPRAVEEAIGEGVTIHVIGDSIDDLRRALHGEPYSGTTVIPE